MMDVTEKQVAKGGNRALARQGITPSFLKRDAFGNRFDERSKLIAAKLHLFANFIQGGPVVIFEASAQCIDQHGLGHAPNEAIATHAGKQPLQFHGSVETFAGWQLAIRLDQFPMLTGAPQADGIEILHGKPKWIHRGMTTGAPRIQAMLLHLFPQGEAFLRTSVVFQFGYVFGGVLGRCSEKILLSF